MVERDEIRSRIIDTAIRLGEHKRSWEKVHLHEVAAILGIPLTELRSHFGDKNAIVHAWFDRADHAMLREADKPSFAALSPRERVQHLMMAWLGALAPYRRLTRQMIFGQLEPNPLRLWMPGALRINRTVRWMMDAARRDVTYTRRVLEESGLGLVYLSTFCYWMNDTSPASVQTHRFLQRGLVLAERTERTLFFGLHLQPSYQTEWQDTQPPSSAPMPYAADEPTI